MDKTENLIFDRLYQSYLTGGDSYSFQYKTESEKNIKEYKEAIHRLEEAGYIEILFQSDKKTRMTLTHKGIDYANSISID